MKVCLSVDLEGIAGVNHPDDPLVAYRGFPAGVRLAGATD